MTAPQVQPPAPEQASLPTPVPEAQGDATAPWPPDEQTLLQLQMDARFSIIEEPAGESTEEADQQAQAPAGPPSPQQPPQQAPPPVQG